MTKIIASCKCGEQKIEIKKLINEFGYLDVIKWQCPKCWNVVSLKVKQIRGENDRNQN